MTRHHHIIVRPRTQTPAQTIAEFAQNLAALASVVLAVGGAALMFIAMNAPSG